MRMHPLHMCGEVTSLSEAAVAERAAMVALLLVDNEDMARQVVFCRKGDCAVGAVEVGALFMNTTHMDSEVTALPKCTSALAADVVLLLVVHDSNVAPKIVLRRERTGTKLAAIFRQLLLVFKFCVFRLWLQIWLL